MNCALLVALLGFSVGVTSITVEVDLFTDSAGVASDCDPANGLCNIRSAWGFCADQAGVPCTINLPADSEHSFDASLGHLVLQSDSNIEIIGNGATISQTAVRRLNGGSVAAHRSSHKPSGLRSLSASDFPFNMTEFEYSNDAKDVFDTACVTACPFDVLTFSACDDGQDTAQDTYFRLYQGDTEVAENDDTCDRASEIEYSVPSDSSCREYCLHMGCFGSSPCATTVTFTHLTVEDGFAQSTDARLILANNTDALAVPTLTLRSLKVQSFGGPYLHGGALLADGQVTLTIDNTSFTSTSGYVGGALYISNNNQEVRISNTEFSQSQGKYGGGIYIGTDVSRLIITDSSFDECTSDDFGGAVFVDTANPDVEITSCAFSSCQAQYGGAIAFHIGNVDFRVSDSNFTDCTATESGGGMYINKDNQAGAVENSAFLLCTAGNNGGGVGLNERNHHFTLQGVSMDECATSEIATEVGLDGSGGGLNLQYINDYVTIDGCRFTGCSARGMGGGVMLKHENSYTEIKNTDFVDCTGAWGAGLSLFMGNHYVTVLGSNLDHCTASQAGGGVFVQSQNTHFQLTNSVVSKCTTAFHGGGIIIMVENDNSALQDVTVSDCEAGSKGGGIMLMTNSNITLQSVDIVSCHADIGGGIYSDTANSKLSAVDLHISYCTADADGGGLYFGRKNNDVTLRDSSVHHCEAVIGSGGGIYLDTQNNDFALESVRIDNCTAYDGGGLYLVSNDHVTIRNSFVTSCSAHRSGGGVNLYGSNNAIEFVNSTIAYNRAHRNGGGVFSGRYNEELMIVGTTVTGNTADNNGGGVYVESGNPQFSLLDQRTHEHRRVVDSAHPYKYIQASFPVEADGAEGFFVYFSDLTSIAFQDKVIITTGTPGVNEETLFDSDEGFWPGINIPALRFRNISSFTVKLQCYSDSFYAAVSTGDGYYGFRLFAIPIYEEGVVPTVISDNLATANGGGLFVFTGVGFPVSMHTEFTGNEATNGGGAYLRNAVVGLMAYDNRFMQNKATYGNGGGVAISSACHAMVFEHCNFTSNRADESGGAVAFTTNNGDDGELDQDNENYFRFCTFLLNHGTLNGGALYLDLANSVVVLYSEFSGGYTYGDGGAIMVSQSNTLYVDGCSVHGNTALVCGGGVAEGTSNRVTLSDVRVYDNYANIFGGGICVKTDSNLALNGLTSVNYNRVGVAGGGIACFGSYMPTSQDTEVEGNFAGRGSGIYLSSINQRSGSAQLAGLTFIENMAGSGTIYWATGGLSEPEGLESPWITFQDNRADFGGNVSTQAVRMHYPENLTITDYGAFLDPPINISLTDHYGNLVLARDPVVVTVSLQDPSTEQCKGRFPFLSGADVSATGVVFVDGIATLESVEISCSPGGSVTLVFTAYLNDLSDDIEEAQRTVLGATTVTFRDCVAGETIVNGKCVVCPAGSYSLTANVTENTVCTECLSLGSVDTCAADEIVLSDGFWRRHASSEAILQCMDELSGCAGGSETGDASCLAGYEGPLCSLCSPGYYRSEKKCIPCVDKKFSPAASFFTAVGGAGLLAVLGFLLFKLQNNGEVGIAAVFFVVAVNIAMWFKKEVRDLKVQMKIVITTFQICSAIPVAMTVAFPPQFAQYLDAMTVFNLNVMSVVPVNCANQGQYNFIDKLVMLTLAPIGLSLLILLACVIEYTYRRISFQAAGGDDSDVQDMREKKLSKVIARYLTLFFLLTYLVLPFIATTLFRTFLCTDLDPNDEDSDPDDLFLTADMRISCTSDYYKRGVAFAAVMIVVFVVGIPLMYLILLYRSRKEIKERFDPLEQPSTPSLPGVGEALDPSVGEQKGEEGFNEQSARKQVGAGDKVVGDSAASSGAKEDQVVNQLTLRHDHAARDALMISFLYEAYEPQYWYWEVVETTRRLMLTAVLSVCGPGTSAQALLAVLLALMYIKLYGFYAPYLKDSDDIVGETGQFQIFLSFLGALVYQRHLLGEEWNNAVGALLILINTAVFFLFLYFAVTTLYREVKTVDISTLSVRQPKGSPSAPAMTPGRRADPRKVYVAPDSQEPIESRPQACGSNIDSTDEADRQDHRVGFVNLHNSQYPLQPDSTVYNVNHSADNSVCAGPEKGEVK